MNMLSMKKILITTFITLLVAGCYTTPYFIVDELNHSKRHGITIEEVSDLRYKIVVRVSDETTEEVAAGYFMRAVSETCQSSIGGHSFVVYDYSDGPWIHVSSGSDSSYSGNQASGLVQCFKD